MVAWTRLFFQFDGSGSPHYVCMDQLREHVQCVTGAEVLQTFVEQRDDGACSGHAWVKFAETRDKERLDGTTIRMYDGYDAKFCKL